MFTIEEIIKLKEQGFTAEDIVELSNISKFEEKPIEEKPIEEKPIEEKPIEEKSIEEKPIEEKPIEEKSIEENKALNELNSFNDKIDELLEQIKINNIKNQFIETPKEISGVDVLANIINPNTKEVIK